MLNVNLYDKRIIDFYLGSPVKGETEKERENVRMGEPCFKVEVLMRRL